MTASPSSDSQLTLGSGSMFDRIARRYDLLNRIMSFGQDRRWRRKTVAAMNLQPGDRVLDVATGTADLALAISKRHDVSVVGLDPSTEMLAIGRTKVEKRGLGERIELVTGDAQDMPFDDNSFCAACMAFGIRNVPDRPKALRELARVIKPGGHIAILELTEPRGGLMSPLARFHIRHIVPRMGALLSGAKEYRYLESSIEAFPPPKDFAAMMTEADLEVVAVKAMTMRSCHLFVARVPEST